MFWHSEHVIPKPIPLVIPEIEVAIEVTLIDTSTHAFKVFTTPNTILKDTHVAKRQGSEHVFLVEPIDTTNEQHVDDLIVRVKHVVPSD
jgi:hypothetical protein